MTLPFGRASFPEMYEAELVTPLFRPFAEAIIDALRPARRRRRHRLARGLRTS